jgi:hypothetical protein
MLQGMTEGTELFRVQPEGEQPLVEFPCDQPVPIDTYAGSIHIDWDPDAPVTPSGQMAFFIAFLKSAGLFDNLVAACPPHYTSPNAPSRRDVLGTALLSLPRLRRDKPVRPSPLRSHHGVAGRHRQSAAARHEPRVERGRDPARVRKDRDRRRRRLVAGATRLHDLSTAERTLDPGRRHDRQAAVWRTGRRCRELQPL